MFFLKLQRCGVAITTGGSFSSGWFGAIRVFYVWKFTLYNMGEIFQLMEVRVQEFVLLGGGSERGLWFDSFNLSKTGDKLPKYAEKWPIVGIDGALDNKEGLRTCSWWFLLVFLVSAWKFTYSQPLTLLFFRIKLLTNIRRMKSCF